MPLLVCPNCQFVCDFYRRRTKLFLRVCGESTNNPEKFARAKIGSAAQVFKLPGSFLLIRKIYPRHSRTLSSFGTTRASICPTLLRWQFLTTNLRRSTHLMMVTAELGVC